MPLFTNEKKPLCLMCEILLTNETMKEVPVAGSSMCQIMTLLSESHGYVHFWINTLGKCSNSLIFPSYGVVVPV